jgi:hypothetical protein
METTADVPPYSQLSQYSLSIFGSRQEAVIVAFCRDSCVGASVAFWSGGPAEIETPTSGCSSSVPKAVQPAIGVVSTFCVTAKLAGHWAFVAGWAVAGRASDTQARTAANK